MANNTAFGANSAIHGTEGMVNANTGITTDYHNGGLSAEMKTFYDKTLIELATPNLVHMQFGQKRPIPPHGGKHQGHHRGRYSRRHKNGCRSPHRYPQSVR